MPLRQWRVTACPVRLVEVQPPETRSLMMTPDTRTSVSDALQFGLLKSHEKGPFYGPTMLTLIHIYINTQSLYVSKRL